MANGNIGWSAMDALKPQASPAGPGSPGRVSGMGPQQAVRIFNLRVPERVSPTAIAPQVLLQSKGSGAPGAGGLDSMVAALMRMVRPQTQGTGVQPALPGGGSPPPVFGPPHAPFTPPSLGSDEPQRPTDTYRGWMDHERHLGGVGGGGRTPTPIEYTSLLPTPTTPVEAPSPRPPNNPEPPRFTLGKELPGDDPQYPSNPSPGGGDRGPTIIGTQPEPPSLFDDSPSPMNWHDIKRGLFDDYMPGWDVQGLY